MNDFAWVIGGLWFMFNIFTVILVLIIFFSQDIYSYDCIIFIFNNLK